MLTSTECEQVQAVLDSYAYMLEENYSCRPSRASEPAYFAVQDMLDRSEQEG